MKTKPYTTLLFLYSTILHAQTELINDDFSTGNAYNWTGGVVSGKQFIVTPGKQTNGTYRGDIKKVGGATLHAGNYPIVAIKMNKPPRSVLFFDSNIGSYNGTNNNQRRIEVPDGSIFYWDISNGTLGSTTLSTTSPTVLSMIQFKITDIVFSSVELAAKDTTYEVQWFKTFTSVEELRTAANADPVVTYQFSGTFKHPGLLHDQADFARMKDYIAKQYTRPYASYQKLIASSSANSNYTIRGPYRYWTRSSTAFVYNGVTVSPNKVPIEQDVNAAYYNAIMWNLTGNAAHANKAIAILDGYADSTEAVVGADLELNGLYAFILANAAELMAHTYSGWPANRVQKCKTMFQTVFYPLLQNFKPCSHGNWDIICMKALMSIAIFTDDVTMYNRVANYFYNGEGNGSIKNYIVSDAGQLQESNRDQGHSTLGIGCLGEIAEMALKQGLDLYAAKNNGIMRGYEYTAQYNNGLDVPFEIHYDYCQRNLLDYDPEAIGASGRGNSRTIFELAYNHYTYRKNIPMPQTLAKLQAMGPEGGPTGADNSGFGSILFYQGTGQDHSNIVTELTESKDLKSASIDYYIANSILHITNLTKGGQVAIYDLYGRNIDNLVAQDNEISINLASNRLFIIKIVSGENIKTIKTFVREQ